MVRARSEDQSSYPWCWSDTAQNIGGDNVRLQRFERTLLFGLPRLPASTVISMSAGVLLPSALKADQQRCLLIGNKLHRHTGLGGVGIENQLDQLVGRAGETTTSSA
jgi:hypothetical protein